MASVLTKLLLGWMDETEAMCWLLKECKREEPFTEESAKKLWNEYREKVAALPARDCAPPTYIAERTRKEEYAEHHFMQKFGKEQSVIRVVKLDNPGALVIHQLSVVLPRSDVYISDMQDPTKRVWAALGRGMTFFRKKRARLGHPPHTKIV